MASKKIAPGSTAKAIGVGQAHSIKVGETLQQNVDGHPPRADSPEFVKARSTVHAILKELGKNFFGDGPIQAHHGGSIWLHDGLSWFMVLNIVGVEWNEQFGADPAKVDVLRLIAKKIVDSFPKTRENLKRLGYDPDPVLDTPIMDGVGIGRYVDSIFNSCVPLPQPVHTGSVTKVAPGAAGVHNYPVPAWGMNFIHRSDFQPFIPIGDGKAVAHVAPLAHKVDGVQQDKRVRVLGVHGDAKHPLHKKHQAAEASGKALVLEAHDPIAQQAHSGPGG